MSSISGIFIRLVIFYPPLLESWLFKKFMQLPFQFLAGRVDFDGIISQEEDYLLPLKKGTESYQKISPENPGRILDLGTGTGVVPLYLRDIFPGADIIGLDAAEDMLKTARKKADEAEVESMDFIKGNIYDLPFPEDTFDLITASNAPFSLTEIKSSLKDDGHLLVTLSHFGSQLHKKEAKLQSSLNKYGFELIEVKSFAENGTFMIISPLEETV